jgi:hypothetical protein
MFPFKKTIRSLHLPAVIVATAAILALDLFWLHNAYRLEYKQFLADVAESFDSASQKEQTYRIPAGEIIHPSDVTIQSCGNEEIRIIRQCPAPDTITFSILPGQSLESWIRRAAYELRKTNTPLNIYCLADLFAGALQEKNILAAFTIDHFKTSTGEIIETTVDSRNPRIAAKYRITAPITSETSLRLSLQFSPIAILKRVAGQVAISTALVVIALAGLFLFLAPFRQKDKRAPETAPPVENEPTFTIGRYLFNPEKNELSDSSQTILLNKKENAILRALCEKNGNVADRNTLLNEHWGNAGLIYSRSLDTYIAKLRKYLKNDPRIQIITIKGQGYKLIC